MRSKKNGTQQKGLDQATTVRRRERKASSREKLNAAINIQVEKLESRTLLSAAGNLDTNFNATGTAITDIGGQDQGAGVAIDTFQSNDIVVAGVSSGKFAVAVYGPAGNFITQAVTSIGSGYSQANAVTIDSSGRILVAGYADDGATNDDFALARYTLTGNTLALDTSFGTTTPGYVTTDLNGGKADIATSLTINSVNGDILVAGVTGTGATEHAAVAAYTSAGVLDTSFGSAASGIEVTTGAADQANAVTIDPSGNVVLAGQTNSGEAELIVLPSNGSSFAKTLLNLGGTSAATSVIAQSNGDYLIAGTASSDFVLAEVTSLGGLVGGFGTGGEVVTSIGSFAEANALAVQTNGKIVLAGFDTVSGTDFFALARYDANGTIDASFGTAGVVTTDFSGNASADSVANGVAIQPDGLIVAAGYTGAGTNPDNFAVARYVSNNAPSAPLNATASLTSIAENEPDNSNPGTSVGTLVTGFGMTDPDGDTVGLAITGVNDTYGTWQYSLDGSTWTAIPSGGGVSDSNALLLAPTASIQFVPKNNDTGSSSITVRAWDQTKGANGTFANVTTNTAANYNSFSALTYTASISVVPPTPPAVVYVNAAWTGSAGGSNVTDSSGQHTYGSDAFATIQAAVSAVASGGTVNVDSGSYVEDVSISNPLTLIGNGSPTVTAPSTGSGAAVITVNAPNVTVEDLNIIVDQPYAGAGIVAVSPTSGPDVNDFSGLKVLNNIITSEGSGGAYSTYLGNYSVGIAAIAYAGGATIPTVTIQGNQILSGTGGVTLPAQLQALYPGLSGASAVGRGIWLYEAQGTVGGSTSAMGNSVYASIEDIEDAENRGPTTIEYNTSNASGITIGGLNANAPLTISNNTFVTPAVWAAFEIGVEGVQPDQLLISADTSTSSPTTVTDNNFTLQTGMIGVLSAASEGVSIGDGLANDGNIFSAANGATGFTYIAADTKYPTVSDSETTGVSNSISIQGNQFGAGNGTAISIADHNSGVATPDYSSIVIGGATAAQENTFNAGLTQFISLLPSTSTAPSGPTRPAADVTNNIDASGNQFGVSSGHTLGAYKLPDYYEIEDKIVDGIDYSGGGLVSINPGVLYVTPNSFISPATDDTNAIQRAINLASSGNTINIEAGTYIANDDYDDSIDGVVQELNIDKPLSLIGPNPTYNPNSDSVPASQAIILPGLSDPDPFDATAISIIGVNASNVTIEGLTIDGDNPALASAANTVSFNGASIDASEGISSYIDVGNINVQGNIIQNTAYDGIDFQNAYAGSNVGDSTSDNVISNNLVRNLADNFGYGVGVIVYDNFYAQVTDNVLSNVYVGVQTGNYYSANNDGTFTPEISGNTISARHEGIFFNLNYGSASAFDVDNNTITALSGGYATPRLWSGIAVTSQQIPNTVEFSGNSINGTGAGFTQASDGYDLWNDQTAGSLSIGGGSVSGVEYGVWANSYEGYGPGDGGAVSATISGVDINASQIGVYVEDSPANTNHPAVSLTINGDTSITTGGSGTGILVTGSNASATIGGDKINGNATGISVSGGKVLAQDNDLTGDAEGVVISGGAVVDLGTDPTDMAVGHQDFTGLGTSTGGNTLTGYLGGAGHFAIDDQNTPQGAEPNVLAEDNNFGPYSPNNPTAIAQVINDNSNNSNLTTVYYLPALDAQIAPTTVYVNAAWAGKVFGSDPGSLGAGHSYGYDEFSDIQSAINAVASGGMVYIYNGEYDPNLVIQNPLTIEGQSESGVTILPSAGGSNGQTAFLVESSNVTIEDLTIDGQDSSPTANFSNGIVTNNDNQSQFLGVANTPYSDLIVQKVTVQNVSSVGVGVMTQGTGNQILDDTFANISSGPGGANAILVLAGSTTISGNVITDSDAVSHNPDDGIGTNALYDSENNAYAPVVTVTDNSISGANVAMYFSGLGAGSVIGGSAPGDSNTIDITGAGAGSYGIIASYLQGAATIEGNQITASGDGTGIALFQDSIAPVSVTGNTITSTGSVSDPSGDAAGILETDDDSLFGEPTTSSSSADINANGISGFQAGIEIQSVDGQSITANIGDGTHGNANTLTGDGTGILVGGANASATITGNDASIYGNNIGIEISGGSAAITDNHIYDNTTGIEFTAGGSGSVSGNNFAYAPSLPATDNGTDLDLDTTAGAVTDGGGNSFAGTTYIADLDNQAPGTATAPDVFNATGDSFDGVSAGSLSLPEAYAAEDKITDYLDNPIDGYVELNPTNVYVSQFSDQTNNGAIQRGVNVAPSGGTVNVQAGVFIGELDIETPITLAGAQAGIDPNSSAPAADDQTIIEPDASDPNAYDVGAVVMINVGVSNVTIDGVTVDGNNPDLSSSVSVNGTMIEAAQGIVLQDGIGNATVQNSIITNVDFAGVDAYGDTPTNDLIQNNSIENFADWGVILFDSGYANIEYNEITASADATGIQLQNFGGGPNPSNSMTWLQNNITVGQDGDGIVVNLFYDTNAIVNINDNTINAAPGVTSGDANGLTWGIVVDSVQPTSTVSLNNNTIGDAGGQFDRGMDFWNVPTTDTVSVTGGSIGHSNVGIELDEVDPFFGGASANSTVDVSNVTITGGTDGVLVDAQVLSDTDFLQSPSNGGNPNVVSGDVTMNIDGLTITGAANGIVIVAPANSGDYTATGKIFGDTSITTGGSGTGILVSGPDASATVTGNDSSIYGNAIGIEVSGGSAAITDNHIYDNTTGIEFTAGGSGSVSGNNFAGSPDNGTDLLIDSTAGAVTIGDGNSFAGAYSILNQSSQSFDLSGYASTSFGGVNLSSASLAQLFTIEDSIVDAIDVSAYGLVRLVADNVYVTPNSYYTPGGTTAASIQRGVDAASIGDTVNVEAGTYSGDLIVDQSVNLSGAEANVDPGANGRSPAPESIIMGDASNGAPIQIDSGVNNVTINGFTIQSPLSGSGALNAGIWMNGSTGITIEYNVLQNNTTGVAIADGSGSINNNLIQNNNAPGAGSGNGIEFFAPGSGAWIISNNHFTGNLSADVLAAGGPTVSNLTIENNQMLNSGGIDLFDTDSTLIFENSLTGVAGAAIYLGGGDSNIEVSQNDISGNTGAAGVELDDPYSLGGNGPGITIHNNFLQNNAYGVLVTSVGLNSPMSVYDNSVSGNTTAGLENDSAEVVNADNNWWGSASGPTNAANPGGTGDTLIDPTVTFSPWLTNGTDADSNRADGFQPVAGVAVSISGSSASTEGALYTLSLSPSSDITSWTINWGDGTNINPDTQTVSGSTTSLTHVFAEYGSYTISATATPVSGPAIPSNDVNVAVADATLTMTPGNPISATEGSSTGTVTVATLTDEAGTYSNPSDLSATINWGDGITTPGTLVENGDTGIYNIQGSHTYAEYGTYAIKATVTDGGGQSANDNSNSSTANVADAALTMTGGVTLNETEGTSTGTVTVATLTDAAGTYSNPNDLTATINWGDGNVTSASLVEISNSGVYDIQGSHTYAEYGAYTITASVTDGGGQSAEDNSDSSTANVADAPLSLMLSSLAPVEGVLLNNAVVATLTDGAGADSNPSDLTVAINWGDGQTSAGSLVSTGGGTYDVEGTHTYANPYTGITFQVTVSDHGGQSASQSESINVAYNPPTVNLTGSATSTSVGSVYTLDIGAVTDPGPDDVTSYAINWGDGTVTGPTAGSPANSTFTHTFEIPNLTDGITITIGDSDGLHTAVLIFNSSPLAGAFNVAVNDVPPTATAENFFPTVTVGSAGLVGLTNPSSVSTYEAGLGFTYSYDFNSGPTDGGIFQIQNSSSSSATVPASYLSSPGEKLVVMRIQDSYGDYTDYSTMIDVTDVAPSVNLGTSPASASQNAVFTRNGSFTYPGSDGPYTAQVDYNYGGAGDPGFSALALNANNTFTLSNTFASTGTYTIAVKVTDAFGTTGMGTLTVDVTPSNFQVTNFAHTASGFDVTFNRAANLAVLNLYAGMGGLYGSPDVILSGPNGDVNGSLVWNPTTDTAEFIKTGLDGTPGVLAAGNYTATLVSGSTAWEDTSGNLLGGGSGVNYVANFTVGTLGDILSFSDFARGPGQAVNLPTTGTTGIPVTLSNGSDVTAVDFDLTYNPSLLQITNVTAGSGLPGDWSITYNTNTPGVLQVTVSGSDALSAGAVNLVNLVANVPADATYGASAALNITNLVINGGAVAGTADSAVEKVAFLGDADGNQGYDGLDASYISDVVVSLATGFNAYPLTDPAIIADLTGSGTLSGQDASDASVAALLQLANQADPGQYPFNATYAQFPNYTPLPAFTPNPTSPTTGLDPAVTIPSDFLADPNGAVTVPINIDDATGMASADFNVTFNPVELNLTSVTAGTLDASGFSIGYLNLGNGDVVIDAFATGAPLPGGSGSIFNLNFTVQNGAATGVTPVDISAGTGEGLNAGALPTTLTDGSVDIHVPTVATPAAANPNPVTGTSTALSVLGADDAGENNLTYTWSYTGPTGVTYTGNTNGTNAAQDITANFTQAGDYLFTATITDQGGSSTTSSVSIDVEQTTTNIIVSPATLPVVPVGFSQQFSASATDQFGNPIDSFTWAIAGVGNSIGNTGDATLGSTPGSYLVTASVGGTQGSATVIAENFAVPVGSTLDINLGSAGPVTLTASGGNITAVQNGVQITLSGFTGVTVTDTATNDVLNFDGPLALPFTFVNTGTSTVNVNSGTLTFAADMGGTVNLGTLAVANGASAVITAATTNSPTTLNLDTLSIGATGVLDMTNNIVLINYGSGPDPISTVFSQIHSGYAGGAWNGYGIMSTTAQTNPNYGLGYADAADPNNPANLAAGQIKIMYTLLGDANLDGSVNGADFTIMSNNFNNSVTNGWDEGDFNYDGYANGDDFTLLADNFNQTAVIDASTMVVATVNTPVTTTPVTSAPATTAPVTTTPVTSTPVTTTPVSTVVTPTPVTATPVTTTPVTTVVTATPVTKTTVTTKKGQTKTTPSVKTSTVKAPVTSQAAISVPAPTPTPTTPSNSQSNSVVNNVLSKQTGKKKLLG